MAASGKKKKTANRRPAREYLQLGGILRLRILELEEEIGLQPYPPGDAARNGRSHNIYGHKVPTPEGMQELFASEVATMRRLGKPATQGYSVEFPPYRICCLPYYYYDGFHALLYVEKEGIFVAGWSEWETDRQPITHPVHVQGGEAALSDFLDHALPAAHG